MSQCAYFRFSFGLLDGPAESYLYFGKTLTFKAKVEGYEMQEMSTILDIQCERKR